MNIEQGLSIVGAGSFGTVVGYLAHVTLERARAVTIRWLGSMIGVLASSAIIAIFSNIVLFSAYAVGLSIAFFGRVLLTYGDNVLADEGNKEPQNAGGASAGGTAPDQRNKATGP
ncbi:MAG: hypothetical protein ACJ8AT_30865 [Hyalangium sp.]|uniref:hypothetical protein n=1 Tax=Hyalangium sp. TaxID=2028555 RepID=UPI00389A2504